MIFYIAVNCAFVIMDTITPKGIVMLVAVTIALLFLGLVQGAFAYT